MQLSPGQKSDYFHRSFVAADGLWFMKVEEERDFDTALELDRRVWEVVPKIQARYLKKLCAAGTQGVDGLKECLEAKLTMEGYEADIRRGENESLRITISSCPWHRKMVDAGREQFAERVGRTICPTEYAVWAREFGLSCTVRIDTCLCGGDTECSIAFVADEAS